VGAIRDLGRDNSGKVMEERYRKAKREIDHKGEWRNNVELDYRER
jgi:hypothetical protein